MSEENKAYEADDGTYDIELEAESEAEVTLPDQEESPVREIPDEEPESDHDQYANSVQKRIDKLTKKMREAERREQAALEYAQNVQSEVNQLKGRVKSLDDASVQEYGSRLQQQQASVEAALKQAVEIGDAEGVVAAQKALTNLAVEGERYRSALSQRQMQSQHEQMIAQQRQAATVQQPQQEVRPDPKAETWAQKNDWFGQDEAMTFAAFGIHKKLVEEEGFDPQSDEYYDEIDKRMGIAFPHKLANGTGKRPAQAVAGVSRGSKAGRGKVRLSRSQVAIAKKLGVPLEEYAKYVKE